MLVLYAEDENLTADGTKSTNHTNLMNLLLKERSTQRR